MGLTEQDIQQIENLKNKYFNSFDMLRIVKGSSKWAKKLSDKDKELMRILIISYGLFTGGNVPTVRNPQKFDAQMAESLTNTLHPVLVDEKSQSFMKSIGLDHTRKVELEDYQNAHDLFSVVSRIEDQASMDFGTLYRGIHSVSENALGAWIQKDAVFDLGNIVSTTIDLETAEDFTSDGTEIRVLLIINNENNIGALASMVSKYPGEHEIILSGKIKTTKVEGLKLKLIDGKGFQTEPVNDPKIIMGSIRLAAEIKNKTDEWMKSKDKDFKIQIADGTIEGRVYLNSVRSLTTSFKYQVVKIWVDLI